MAERVLIVDDEPNLRKVLGAHLQREGYETILAPDGEEALSLIDKGGIDVLVLDGEAVPTGGMGICRQLKDEIYNCPPVLILTGRRDDAWLASWSRADAAVPHPIDGVTLAPAVADLMRRRLAHTPVR